MSYNLILLKKTSKEHEKWRILVITFTFLFFVASVILVVLDNILGLFSLHQTYNCTHQLNPISLSKNNHYKLKYTTTEESDCFITNDDKCLLYCISVDVTDITEKSNHIICKSDNLFLKLENVKFKNQSLQKGWLKDFENPIHSLEINSKELRYLGDGSFAGKPFNYLNTLTLINTNIEYISQDAFLGSSIVTFEFRVDNMLKSIGFEEGVFKHIEDYLQTLQINKYLLQPEAIKNLTGSNTLSNLESLDLRNNQIKRINNESFIGTQSLTQVFLSSSNIQYIERDAFMGLGETVRILDLRDNKLKTLPQGTFNGFTTKGLIGISENHWICDCELQWLKDFYKINIDNYFNEGLEKFYCYTEEGIKHQYDEIDFCPHLTTQTTALIPNRTIPTTALTTRETTETTTPSELTTLTTVTPNNNFIQIHCKDCSIINPFDPTLPRSYSHTVFIRNGTISYDFYRIHGTPYYDIILEGPIESDYMIWININNHEDIGCLFNANSKITLGKIKYEHKYLICLLKAHKTEVSPFDCTSLFVPPSWEDTPWILNKNKILIIGLLVMVLFIVIVITAALVYIAIKRHPKLIKHTKNAKRRRSSLFEKEYQYINPPSLYSNSDGYLTPKLGKVDTVNNSSRVGRKLSTISEKDAEGPFNVIYKVSKINEQELKDPPPLPPNHPSSFKNLMNIDDLMESQYVNEPNSKTQYHLKGDQYFEYINI